MKTDTKAHLNALLIHKALRRNPATKADLCSSLGLEDAEFAAAVKYSRSSDGKNPVITNEIIGVTKGKTPLYFLAKTAEEADMYMGQRYRVVTGHFNSITNLLEKELIKFPEQSRDISFAIKTVERAQQDLEALLVG